MKRLSIPKFICSKVLYPSFQVKNGVRPRIIRFASSGPIFDKRLSYFHCNEELIKSDAHFGDLITSAANYYGDSIAVIDRENKISKTYLQYRDDIYKLAAGLLSLGFKRGDKIAIWSPNRYEYTVTQYAASIAGLILVTLNPVYELQEVEFCIKKLQINGLVTLASFKTKNYYNMLNTLIPEIQQAKLGKIQSKAHPYFRSLILLSDENLPGSYRYCDVLNSGGSQELSKLERLHYDIQPESISCAMFTSGTTGTPKAAVLSNFSFLNAALIIAHRLEFFKKSTRICCNVPLFHIFGLACCSAAALASGSCLIFPSQGFNAAESLKTIEEAKCNVVLGVPTMYVDMLASPQLECTNFSTPIKAVVGGAHSPPALLSQIVAKMNCTELIVGYGSTETSGIAVSQNPRDPVHLKYDNVGKVTPNTEIKIVDQKGNIAPLDTPGEICVRGPQVMTGYWEDEESSKEVWKNGWYHTGDIGTLNKNGHVSITGRLKDMIIRGGENIYPKEIEDYLTTHPQITDAYVVGVPDYRLGEELCAWIKTKNNETMTEEEIRQFCKQKLAYFKIPHYIRFVEDFPKTGSGKIQKHVIREEMIKLLGL